MNEIQLFNSPQFGEIRTAGTPDNPLFCLVDICRILDVRPDGVMKRISEDGYNRIGVIDRLGREQLTIFITEKYLYKAIMRSDKPNADPFQDWVCGEVIPQIRKKGVYATDSFIEKSIASPEYAIRVLTALKEERELNKALAQENATKQALLEEQKPKVLFADAVATAKQSCLIGELAKILKQNGVNVGQNRLFTWLREKDYLGKYGAYYNIPTQKAMELGLFEIKKTTVNKPDGSILVTTTTKVIGKGQVYFINKFLGGRA